MLSFFVSVVLAASVQSPQVAYYAYEEAAGTTAADSSGNALNGTHTAGVIISAVGDCAPVPAGNQRSIILNKPGTVPGTGYYVTTPNSALISFTGPFTAAAWVKPSAFAAGENPNDRGAIIHKWNYVNPPGAFNGYGLDRTLAGTFQFYTGTAAGHDTHVSTGTAPLGVWTHVAAVYTAAQTRIYINGVLDSSRAPTQGLAASTIQLQVGKDDYWRNFYGNIDEVRLFNRDLTAGEIGVLHTGMAAPVVAAAPGPNQITLTWAAVPGATGYTVSRSLTSGAGFAPIGTTALTTFTDTGVTFPTRYYYIVVANGIINSPNSAEVSAIPDNPAPRTEDHEEGLFGESCSCGAAAGGATPGLGLLVLLAGLLAVRRR